MSGGGMANFVYDPLGRRTSKTINSVVSQFAYDGNDIVAEIGGGAVGANYLRSLNIDEPFIRQMSAGNEHYHADALGSSLVLSNGQGVSATTYTYEPFGITSVSGTSSNSSQYSGRENDNGSIYFYRMRYYSPEMHRFVSRDPLQLIGGDINYYAYSGSNPIRFRDPWGLDKSECTATANWTGLFASAGNVAIGQVRIVAGISLVTVGATADVTGIGALLGVPAQVYGTYQLTTGVARATKGFIGVYRSALECSNESLADAAARLLPLQVVTEPLFFGSVRRIDSWWEHALDILAQ